MTSKSTSPHGPPDKFDWHQEKAALQPGAELTPELKASNEAIIARYPVEPTAHQITERARTARLATEQKQQSGRRKGLLLLAPLGAAAALVLVPMVTPTTTPVAGNPVLPSTGTERIKGEPVNLRIYKAGPQGPELMAKDQAAAQPGDILQVATVAHLPAHLMVFSIDGRGTVTQHLPQPGVAKSPSQEPGEKALAHGYELDDAPKFERFFVVSGLSPIEVAPVLDAAHRLAKSGSAAYGKLKLDAKLSQDSFLVRKVNP